MREEQYCAPDTSRARRAAAGRAEAAAGGARSQGAAAAGDLGGESEGGQPRRGRGDAGGVQQFTGSLILTATAGRIIVYTGPPADGVHLPDGQAEIGEPSRTTAVRPRLPREIFGGCGRSAPGVQVLACRGSVSGSVSGCVLHATHSSYPRLCEQSACLLAQTPCAVLEEAATRRSCMPPPCAAATLRRVRGWSPTHGCGRSAPWVQVLACGGSKSGLRSVWSTYAALPRRAVAFNSVQGTVLEEGPTRMDGFVRWLRVLGVHVLAGLHLAPPLPS